MDASIFFDKNYENKIAHFLMKCFHIIKKVAIFVTLTRKIVSNHF